MLRITPRPPHLARYLCNCASTRSQASTATSCASASHARATTACATLGPVDLHLWNLWIALSLKGAGCKDPPAVRLMHCKKGKRSKQSFSVATRREGTRSLATRRCASCAGEHMHGVTRLDWRAASLPSRPPMNVHRPWGLQGIFSQAGQGYSAGQGAHIGENSSHSLWTGLFSKLQVDASCQKNCGAQNRCAL